QVPPPQAGKQIAFSASTDSPDPPAAALARNESDGETRALLRRRLLVIFSILSVFGAVDCAFLSVFGASDIPILGEFLAQVGWWFWLVVPGVWGALVAVLAARRRSSLAFLRACELIGFGFLWAPSVWFTVLTSDPEMLRRQVAAFGGVILQA